MGTADWITAPWSELKFLASSGGWQISRDPKAQATSHSHGWPFPCGSPHFEVLSVDKPAALA